MLSTRVLPADTTMLRCAGGFTNTSPVTGSDFGMPQIEQASSSELADLTLQTLESCDRLHQP